MLSLEYFLVDEEGNVIKTASHPGHLKEVFDRSGLEKAYVRLDTPKPGCIGELVVTRETTNEEWNQYKRDYHDYF